MNLAFLETSKTGFLTTRTIFIISLEESIALVEDSYLANLEAELKEERFEKEKRVNDLTNALKNEKAKLEEMKLKRDSIKGQVHH